MSIALTVFNSERYLEDGICSLLAQTFEDFELIITDNASTDGTRDLATTYAEKDDRIRYVRNRTNIGVAGNFNQGFRLSSGEYFKWAAYDDLCAPRFLQQCVEVLDRDPEVVLAYTRVRGIDEQGRPTNLHDRGPDLTSADPAVRFSSLMRAPFWATSLFGVIRSSALARTLLMPSNAAADHVLLSELSLHGRFHEIPVVAFFNRDHPDRAFTKSSIARRAQQVDPRLGKSPLILRARQIWAYLSVVGRTPLDQRSRASCYYAVGRWVVGRLQARMRPL